MDVDDAGEAPESGAGDELESRAPRDDDLVLICRRLNELKADYMVIGGFAMIMAGYPRATVGIDLLIATDSENEARVLQALEILPDQAVRELKIGEIDNYGVVRVADEVVVDLMKSASGIDYTEAAREVVIRHVKGVPIPFASPRLLFRMKKVTHREKDAPDLLFLQRYFAERGAKGSE
jgi:hypothetical protein